MADKTLKVTIDAKDNASAPFAKVGNSAQSMGQAIEKSGQQAAKSAEIATKSAQMPGQQYDGTDQGVVGHAFNAW